MSRPSVRELVTLGLDSDYRSVAQEMVRQATLYSLDPSIYAKYVSDFVMSCLIPRPEVNFGGCSQSIIETTSLIYGVHIDKSIMPRSNAGVISVLAGQAFAVKRLIGTFRPGVRINGVELRVGSL